MSVVLNGNWNYPTQVWSGPGRIADLPQACELAGITRPLVVTDKGLADSAIIARVGAVLDAAGVAHAVFAEVQGNPVGKNVEDGTALYRSGGHDGVVAVGGGSGLDVAKAIALLSGQNRPLWDFEDVEDWWTRADPAGIAPVVAVPTTAGTGSEVTPIAIITTGETTKTGIVSPLLYADVALLDADLTLGLPPAVTAATGIDAMVHAIEAFTSKRLKNPLSDALAVQALQLLATNLVPACQDGKNVQAREAMLLGAMLAGQAFANAPVAAVHALAYPLGGVFHLPHGLSNALVLPHVLRFNAEAAAPHYAALAEALLPGVQGGHHAKTTAFISHLQALITATGLPMRLRDHGVDEAALPRLASDAMQQTRLLVNNPREVSEADALAVYQQAY